MKAQLVGIAGVVIGASVLIYFGGTVAPTDIVATKEAEQASNLQTKGKYVHEPRAQCSVGIECQVDEMLHPDGTRGYAVTEWRTNANGSVDKRVTSKDKDVISTAWVQIQGVPTVSATST